MRAVALLALLAGCGDDITRTWGDVTEAFAREYCAAAVACGLAQDRDACVALFWPGICASSCDVPIDDVAARDALGACCEALRYGVAHDQETDTCFRLGFGWLPQECDAVWDMEPEPDGGR